VVGESKGSRSWMSSSSSSSSSSSEASDLALALALQSEEYNYTDAETVLPRHPPLPHHPPLPRPPPSQSSKRPLPPPSSHLSLPPPSLSSSQWTGNINTAEAELLDPTPDIRALFLDFNSRFFSGKLSSCEVKWSKRMTLCAGVCSFDGGLCSIRLSEPLLSLRPRSDLVNTLCHEMIHGWDFLVTGERSRDGHGPSFLRKAKEINDSAGTNITVYHSFNDEVEKYRTHVWKCNGPCSTRSPFFGVVKRSTNRAPQKADYWFAQHAQECGGSFTKISEPEPPTNNEGVSKKRKRKGDDADKKDNQNQTLDSFWKTTRDDHLPHGLSSAGAQPSNRVKKESDLKKVEEGGEKIEINLIDDDDDDDSVVIISIDD